MKYTPCSNCGTTHTIACQNKTVKLTGSDGTTMIIPEGRIFFRVGKRLYISGINPPDETVVEHTQTFRELWSLHGLPPQYLTNPEARN